MLNSFFPVRPVPQLNESLKGFTLRVAYHLGYQTLNELHNMIGVRYSKGCYGLRSEASKRFVSKLALLLQMDVSELQQCFCHFDVAAVVYERIVKDIHNLQPKVCVECAKETQGYIMSHDSLLAHHTHCEKHQIELIDTCPACKEPLLWISNVFEGCSCWQVRWRDLEGLSSQIPVYQKVASELTGIERKTYLTALYQSMVIMLRPRDAINHCYRTMPLIKGNLSEIFNQAYALLVNPMYQSQLFQMQKQHWLGIMPTLPVQKLLTENHQASLVGELPITQCEMTFDNYVTELPNKIEKVHIDAQFLLTRLQVAGLLSISEEDVMSLQQHALLSILNPESKSYLFDMREVSSLSERLIAKGVTTEVTYSGDEFIFVSDISPLALKNACSLGQLFKQFISGGILLYHDDATKFGNLYVNKKELINYFEMTFFDELKYPLSLSRLKNLTCLADEEQPLFVKYLEISPFSVNAKKDLYPPEQLRAFFKENILLNRWAKLNKVKAEDIRFYLKNYEIVPICKVLDKEGIYIYAQDLKLIKILRQYLLDSQRYKGELPLSLCLKYIQLKSPQVFLFFK